MFENRTVDDLVRSAAAGGGFRFQAARRTTDDLVRIAAAASNKGGRLYFHGLGNRTVDDLVRIGAAGKGSVVFDDD
jgi:DNA replication protein